MESALHSSTFVSANAGSKGRTIVYWIMTVLVAFPIGSGGIAQLMQYFANPHGVVPVLGYPMYFFAILGFWKFFGALTILVPGFPRLKEWAYAGIFFDLTGAAASCAMSGGWRVRISYNRSVADHGIHGGVMGASTAKPHTRNALPAKERRLIRS